jgi:hypothetical protein
MVGEEERYKSLTSDARDEMILREHLPAFRMTTYTALSRLFFDTVNAARKWISRRKADGYIASATLTSRRRQSGDRDYFHLTPTAVKALDLDTRLAKPLGPGGLANAYAILGFCCLGERRYHKASAREFAARFPTLLHDRLQTDYYYRDDDFAGDGWEQKARIGYVYPDTDRAVPTIVNRLEELIAARRAIDEWREKVIDRDRFLIAVVTTSGEKRKRILEALEAQPRTVPVRIVVHEDIREVIPQKGNRATSSRTDA